MKLQELTKSDLILLIESTMLINPDTLEYKILQLRLEKAQKEDICQTSETLHLITVYNTLTTPFHGKPPGKIPDEAAKKAHDLIKRIEASRKKERVTEQKVQRAEEALEAYRRKQRGAD